MMSLWKREQHKLILIGQGVVPFFVGKLLKKNSSGVMSLNQRLVWMVESGRTLIYAQIEGSTCCFNSSVVPSKEWLEFQ